MCLINDASGFVAQIAEVDFAAKHINFKNEWFVVFVVFPVHTCCLQCSNEIQTHMLIARVFTYSLLLLVVFACCVAFVIQLKNTIWVHFPISHSHDLSSGMQFTTNKFKVDRVLLKGLVVFVFMLQPVVLLFCDNIFFMWRETRSTRGINIQTKQL